jgi:non-ribosomal peptide synthetase component E (peptide arylation enzyme)
MLRLLLAQPSPTDSSRLRTIVVGGAPLDRVTAERGRELLGCSVVNLYGSADGVSCHTHVEGIPDGDGVAGRPDPRIADLRIVDDDLHEVSPGEVGEIVSRGPMTPMCYVGAPELNKRYRTKTGWVRTGDAGYLDHKGNLTIVGRRKDVIIRGGLNISPAQVETLLTTHPDICDAACVPVTDALLGERMCACVASDTALQLQDLTEHLAAQGLEQRKFPELVVVLPRLPWGAAGKIDRRALRDLAEKRSAAETVC